MTTTTTTTNVMTIAHQIENKNEVIEIFLKRTKMEIQIENFEWKYIATEIKYTLQGLNRRFNLEGKIISEL